MLEKIIGVILILAGIGGLSNHFITSVIFIVLGIYLLKDNKSKKAKELEKIEKVEVNQTYSYNEFETYVAGITKTNIDGKNIQKLVKDYLKDNADSDDFGGLSKKELKEELYFETKVYKYELDETNTIKLVPEPTNKYDKNAIMIVHDEMGHIGYVPAKHAIQVKKIIDSGIKELSIKLRGGPYKISEEDDYGEEIIKTVNSKFYFNIYIKY